MPKTRSSIPLNDGILSTLRPGVEVSCEPPRVNARRLLVLLVCGNIGRSHTDSSPDRVPPPTWRQCPTNRRVIDGKTKDHDDILQRHCGLPTRKVEHVYLRTSPVHKCHQRGRIHHRQIVGNEPSKRYEPRTPYERRVPFISRQGAMRADTERLQTLWNTTILQKY
jgi:hypothetical protein